MLVSIHIPFSQAARARRFTEVGDASDGRVFVMNTDELNEPQRAHLLRMVSRGETARSVFGEPDVEFPHNVYLTTYGPAPNVARVLCSVRYLDFSNLGDAGILNVIGKGSSEKEIVQLALTGDIERWNVALATARARLDVLVSAWKRETGERIRKLRALKDDLVIAEVRHCGLEHPQWLEDVVAAGDIEALELFRQLADAFREARIRLK